MAVIGNLRIPWTTTKAQDNNFDVSRDQLTDPGNQIEVLDSAGLPATNVDWSTITFTNLVSINGILITSFLLNLNNENIGTLLDVDSDVSSGPVEGDVFFYDGAIWNRLPRGSDGQFLKATTTGIAWGTGTAQLNDFSDGLFRIFNAGDAGKIIAFDAGSIQSGFTRTFTLPDGDGVLARISDIPVVGSSFSDSAFNVFDDGDPTKILKFQIAGITPATTRTATWPDKDGVVAFISDIVAPGNTFEDNVWRILDNVDNSKQFALQMDQLTTATTITLRPLTTATKTFDIPDATDGDEFLMETFPQTVQNKTIDNTNTVDNGALSGDVVLETQANSYSAGTRQSFLGDIAGTAGLNLGAIAGDPTTKIDADMWLNTVSGKAFIRIAGVDIDFSSAQPMPSSFIITASDELTDLVASAGSPTTTFRMPFAYTLDTVPLGVRASVRTAPVGADIIIDIKQNNVSILSTLLTIDAGELTSTTAVTPAVISTNPLTDDAEIEVFVTQIGSTTAGTGLKVYLIGTS